MPGVVLDTSVLIAHLRGADVLSRPVRQAVLSGDVWVVSAISQYEVYRLAKPSEWAAMDVLWASCVTVDVTARVSREAARVWAELRADGYTVDVPDQFIAATARLYDLPVATFNLRHFSWVPGLRVLHPSQLIGAEG